jgi:hypothetical protein
MKKIILNVILAAVLAAALSACGGGNKMNMTTAQDKVEIKMAGSGEVTIDWGDGNEDKGSLKDILVPFSHVYSSASLHTITVSGDSIKYLDCSENQITGLNVSKNIALTRLMCEKNQLTDLNVSKNTALTWLMCHINQLTDLDVSKNTALTALICEKNQLINLDVSKNTKLDYLDCSDNQLTVLDVSKNTALTKLFDCGNNQLTGLDVSKNTQLGSLYCFGNQLTSLDVSDNTVLTVLYCFGNQLTSLDVSKNTALTELLCDNNQLTVLDVSQNTALTKLHCYDNKLATVDVSRNKSLKDFKNFNWPPKQFPASVPFKLLNDIRYCKIESIVCLGRDRTGYKFLLTGVGTGDTSRPHYSLDFYAEEKDGSGSKRTCAAAYMFTTKKQGERFEMPFQGLWDGMYNPSKFAGFVIKL